MTDALVLVLAVLLTGGLAADGDLGSDGSMVVVGLGDVGV